MVAISQVSDGPAMNKYDTDQHKILGLVALAFGAVAQCKRRAHVVLFDGNLCEAPSKSISYDIEEGDCEDRHHQKFVSYQVTHTKHWKHKGKGWEGASCRVHVYDDRGCKGPGAVGIELPKGFGKCVNGTISDDTAGHFTIGHSLMLICDKKHVAPVIQPPRPRPSVTTFSTVFPIPTPDTTTISVTNTTIATVPATTVMILSPIASSVSSSSTLNVQSSKKISSTPSVGPSFTTVTSTNTVSPTLYTAYVKTTTTIIAPPTATIEGTTTVWVRPTSSHAKVRTDTYVVTVSDAALAPRELDAAISAQQSKRAAQTPDVVVRAASDSVECYASVDGHWIVSTCAPPSPKASS
ncbi:hypothetical protein ANO11243_053630 [Dothideomycetidae sp. 11243]|nr:hypothetical protein ANO11243_053630 [fungal sp. No.11243]